MGLSLFDLSGKRALITGSSQGIGFALARGLAQAGADVVMNGRDEAKLAAAAKVLRDEGFRIHELAFDVTDHRAVRDAVDGFEADHGAFDILVNNAGILRDKSFSKMELADFRLVLDVHLMGSANCTRAVWNVMREQQYGRIVMTTSCSGLFGNFGQANYAAAKMGLVGLMQTLGIEGEKHNIRVNCLAPTGATRMMEGILPPEQLSKFKPELVSPAVLALVSEQAPNRAILSAGAGSFELVQLAMTQGIALGEAASAEDILQQWSALSQRDQDFVPTQGFDQARHELHKGGFHFEA